MANFSSNTCACKLGNYLKYDILYQSIDWAGKVPYCSIETPQYNTTFWKNTKEIQHDSNVAV